MVVVGRVGRQVANVAGEVALGDTTERWAVGGVHWGVGKPTGAVALLPEARGAEKISPEAPPSAARRANGEEPAPVGSPGYHLPG